MEPEKHDPLHGPFIALYRNKRLDENDGIVSIIKSISFLHIIKPVSFFILLGFTGKNSLVNSLTDTLRGLIYLQL